MHDFDADLDAYLLGDSLAWTDDADPLDEEPPDLADLDELDKLLFRVRLLAGQEAQIDATAQRRLDEIVAWRDDLTAGIRRRRAWLERSAVAFAEMHFAGQPDKIKTVKVANGEIRRRAQQLRVADVSDDIAQAIHDGGWADLAPYGKAKVSKNDVKAACVPGDALGEADAEGYVPRQACVKNADPESGEVTLVPIPGLVLMVPTTDKITAHTN